MKPLTVAVSLVAVGAALRHASQRLASHQPVLPGVTRRINTQVHRINQS